MSSEEKILERILSNGVWGIKKTDLKKEFNEIDVDKTLENLSISAKVCLDKKGTSYYCWTNEGYIQHLMNSDPKFRITYDSISSLEKKLDDQTKAMKEIINNTVDLLSTGLDLNKNDISSENSMQLESFKAEFDSYLSKINNSIGWVEFANVRNEVGTKFKLNQRQFYDLVEELINTYHDEYELSTGGEEGIVVRGLIHGYVRGI